MLKRRGSRLNGKHEDLFSGAFWTGRRALSWGLLIVSVNAATILERFGDDTR